MTKSAFESSLAAVRDNIVMAIERREIGVVEDGLAVYKRLIERYLDEQLRLQAPTESPISLPLSREWERLVRDLYGIMDSVSASPSHALWIDMLSWVKTVADACADRGVLNALGSVLGLYETAWRQELASPDHDAASRQDAFLLRLSEFGMIRRVRRGRNPDAEYWIEVVYTRTFLRVIKQSIESRDAELAKISVEYFLHGSKGPTDDDTRVADAGLLMIYAWILYRFDHDDQPANFNIVLREISSAFQRTSAFYPILRAADALENELGVHWWEMRGRGPMTGGVIQIGSYISLALILVGGFHLQFEQLDTTNDDDVSLARRLLSVIESVEKGGFSKALGAVQITADSFTRLKEHLTSVVQANALTEEQSYAHLPLDADRVTSFQNAVVEKLVYERTESLAAALRTEPPSSVGSPGANFGLDSLLPRWYFAETRVFAEPERLAEELVRGLGRGEEDRILDIAVGDLIDVDEIAIEDLASKVDSAVSDLSLPAVVVTNSYQAHSLLTRQPSDVPSDKAAGLTVRTRVVRVYDDRPPYVTVLSPSGLPTVHVLTPTAEVSGDVQLEGGRAIVGVSELSDAEMNRIAAEKERTPLEEARLRGSVRVRLLEHFIVSIDNSRTPPRWKLPEGTW